MATQAYYDWRAAGRPFRVARPIAELVTMARNAGVSVLGTIGNEDHLQAGTPEDHTPFSATAWPIPLPDYVVTAGDFGDGPHSDRLLADARAGRLPWAKYFNFRRVNYSVRRGWEGRSNSDSHLHVSIKSDHTYVSLGGYNPFTGQQQEEDVNADQDRQLRSAEFRLHHLFQMDPTVEGDPFGGTYEIKLVNFLTELRADLDAVKTAVEELRGRPAGVVSIEDHEKVMRRIYGEADGAVPPAAP